MYVIKLFSIKYALLPFSYEFRQKVGADHPWSESTLGVSSCYQVEVSLEVVELLQMHHIASSPLYYYNKNDTSFYNITYKNEHSKHNLPIFW